MKQHELTELYDKLVEAESSLPENDPVQKLISEAISQTISIQLENNQEQKNLKWLGIDTEDINKIINLCEKALEIAGFSDSAIADYNDRVADSLECNCGFKDITNNVIREYLYSAAQNLESEFALIGVEAEADYDVNGFDSHLYINHQEITGSDFSAIYDIAKEAVKEKFAEVFDKLGISPDVIENAEGDDLKKALDNMLDDIVAEINEKYGTDFAYSMGDDDYYIEITVDDEVKYSADNFIEFAGVLDEISNDYQQEKARPEQQAE